MMMGHYSGAFLAKRIAPDLPLWAAFLAVQLVDIAFAFLVAAGLERVSFDASLASNAMVLEHIPYTHSLLATSLWAGAAFVVVRWVAPAAAPVVASATAFAVLSHWLGDVLVHRSDMTVFGGAVLGKFGLAIWDYPLLGLAVELGLLVGSALWCVAPGGPLHAARQGVGILVAGMAAVQTASSLGFAPPILSSAELVVGGLFMFFGLPILARAAARQAERDSRGSEDAEAR